MRSRHVSVLGQTQSNVPAAKVQASQEGEERIPAPLEHRVPPIKLIWGHPSQCVRTRDAIQPSTSDCSQATARLDSLIGTGNWFCEMSL